MDLLKLLVVALGYYLLPCVSPTMWHYGLPILIELMLLDLLLVVDIIVHGRLGVVICITFCVKVMIERLL